MNCSNCGNANAEGSQYCASCGAQLFGQAAPPAPPVPPAPEGYGQPAAAGYDEQVAGGYTVAPPPAAPAPPAYGQQYTQPQMHPQPGYAPAPPVKNHLVMAILATVLCCIPLGAVGIIYAAQVNSKLASGDYAGAQRASKNALIWSWVAIGGGLIGGVLYAVLAILGVVVDSL
ncbi:MAG: CD225/dispanin family protein [Coriobacteriia bacterium]|nr:CD225/dispanin family protein [Coriobacteriia bacterium]